MPLVFSGNVEKKPNTLTVGPILLQPCYFGSIAQFVALTKAESLVFEVEDNYQKQSFRNRSYIAHTNGRLSLNIPVKHSKTGQRLKTKEVKIEYSFPWQSQHWKSLQTAYRTSPYFEYYEDDLYPLFHQEVPYLLDFNFKCFEVMSDLLQLDIAQQKTLAYKHEHEGLIDLRCLANAKSKSVPNLQPYTQVFESHHGFLPNLSILDLLFNEGTNALTYLQEQDCKL